MAEERENWSWSKFLKGFFDGRNYAKALVLGFCMTVILIIVFSVTSTISSRFKKVKPTQSVESNNGIIATQNEDKSGNQYALFNLFNWK